jgi:hypothetical protein
LTFQFNPTKMVKLTKNLKLKILTNKFVPKKKVEMKEKKKGGEREFWYSNPTLLSQSLPKLPFTTGQELLQRHKASTPEVWSSFLKILLDRKEYKNILKAYQENTICLNQSGLTCVLMAIANLGQEENLTIAKKAFDSLEEKSTQNNGTMLLVYAKLSGSYESNVAVLEILNNIVKPDSAKSKQTPIDIQTCNNVIMACKAFYSPKTMEIASTLFNAQPKPDDQLISTYLSILFIDAVKNRTEFLSIVSKHYNLESRHFKSNTTKTTIPLKTWTILLYFCMKIQYPLLGLSWYEARFDGEEDEVINNALGSLYKQTQNFRKALEIVKDPLLRIRICVDAQDEKVEGDFKDLVGLGKEMFKGLDEVTIRTCFDMIMLLDKTGKDEDIEMMFDIVIKHKREVIDKTRDMLEDALVKVKKMQVNKELKLRVKLLRVVKVKLDGVADVTVELDLLKRRIKQVLDLCKI